MSRIEFSSGFMSALPYRIFRLGESPLDTTNPASTVTATFTQANQLGGCGLFPGATTTGGFIQIFKGTMPLNFSGLTAYTSESANKLVEFSVADGAFSPTQMWVKPVIITTLYRAAVASGQATWFRAGVLKAYYHPGGAAQFMGTVGLIGSGADLEISDTNILIGSTYRVRNLRINFPSFWDY